MAVTEPGSVNELVLMARCLIYVQVENYGPEVMYRLSKLLLGACPFAAKRKRHHKGSAPHPDD